MNRTHLEHAQRELKIGNPETLVGYEALDFWRWDLDSVLDFVCPAVAVLGVVALAGLVPWAS